ncbi:hypothetical protein KO498_17160 [Lentibacter algarum]|uniref:hypothetical protein n=1 Tax=Lentibacter algarum TaxID=576131 RepID=UPI001C08301B|nr:hypothetical protein [Lentibacter algarum]MBU2983539.1 hypothetical protein [Lentibacter algarum]
MKFVYPFALAVFCSPAFAAPVCEMGGAEPVELLETAKAEFLRGDFQAFKDITTEIMGTASEKLEKPIAQLEGLFPDGFESCQTIVQRRDSGGMVQEVTTFNIKGQDFPMSVYLLAAPIRGELKVGYLNFNTTMTEVLKSLY